MRLAEKKVTDKLSIFNLGTDEIITVNQSIKYICDIMDVKPKLEYKGGDRGWVGDSPLIHLNIDKISKLGWSPDFTIKDSVKFTANWLLNNKWIYEIRN